ncbi:MAG: YbaN family protein [Acholeplasmataceae bacterium]|jgi:uncharacterized membrane protein YbaN (DUF454 family)|nr:YbaN family protein [Acholeplasmataceae bacterium]MDD4194091.1 YbaN family protein [Acholeplasmataceae bacterium]
MKTIYILLGHIFLCLGLIGIILPILPTTPFLLLTAYFFAKGSKRFQHWFEQTKIYQKHLEPFIRTKSMTRKQKWTLMIFVDTLLIISIIIVSNLYVRIFIILIIILKHLYFHTQIKTTSS